MSRVLFVCTGNVFRSMTAELLMTSASAAAASGLGMRFSSAGTHAGQSRLRSDVRAKLDTLGLDARSHTPRLLTAAILDDADLVVAMGRDHKDYIAATFNRHAVLFMEVARGRADSIPDLPEVIPDYKNKPDESKKFINETIDLIAGERWNFLNRVGLYLPSAPGKNNAVSPQP